jgi:hypothetical protein
MTMEQIDQDLRQLFGSEGKPLDADREESISEMIAQSFRGQTRWLALLAGVKIAGTLAIAVLAAVFFFLTESAKAHLALASVFVVALIGCMLWWMWYWLLVQRNAQAREIKRLELQVAKLASAQPR